jgi:hypothetical protein
MRRRDIPIVLARLARLRGRDHRHARAPEPPRRSARDGLRCGCGSRGVHRRARLRRTGRASASSCESVRVDGSCGARSLLGRVHRVRSGRPACRLARCARRAGLCGGDCPHGRRRSARVARRVGRAWVSIAVLGAAVGPVVGGALTQASRGGRSSSRRRRSRSLRPSCRRRGPTRRRSRPRCRGRFSSSVSSQAPSRRSSSALCGCLSSAGRCVRSRRRSRSPSFPLRRSRAFSCVATPKRVLSRGAR